MGYQVAKAPPTTLQVIRRAKRLTKLFGKVILLYRAYDQPECCWEAVLLGALNAVRSLLCTTTNVTPPERLFAFNRRRMTKRSLPSWLV